MRRAAALGVLGTARLVSALHPCAHDAAAGLHLVPLPPRVRPDAACALAGLRNLRRADRAAAASGLRMLLACHGDLLSADVCAFVEPEASALHGETAHAVFAAARAEWLPAVSDKALAPGAAYVLCADADGRSESDDLRRVVLDRSAAAASVFSVVFRADAAEESPDVSAGVPADQAADPSVSAESTPAQEESATATTASAHQGDFAPPAALSFAVRHEAPVSDVPSASHISIPPAGAVAADTPVVVSADAVPTVTESDPIAQPAADVVQPVGPTNADSAVQPTDLSVPAAADAQAVPVVQPDSGLAKRRVIRVVNPLIGRFGVPGKHSRRSSSERHSRRHKHRSHCKRHRHCNKHRKHHKKCHRRRSY